MISVALCTFNGEKFISQQLDSILSQSVPVDEIVVCDDGSTDSTCQILEQYAAQSQSIRLIKNEHNLGYIANFEKAIRLCQGDYIFLSDQDDIWHPDKVAESIGYLSSSGMFGAFTDARIIDTDGKETGHTLFQLLNLRPYIEKGILQKHLFEIMCLRKNFVTGATLVLTKAGKEMVLPFRNSSLFVHDGWISLRLSSTGKLGFIDKPLIGYRTHTGQQLGLDFNPAKDFLADCFDGNGIIKQLMRLRRRYGALSKACGFGKEQNQLAFRTYFDLWKNNHSRGIAGLYEGLLFLLTELFVFLKLDNSNF